MTSIKELFADYPETRQAIKLITEGTKEDILIGIELLKKDYSDFLLHALSTRTFLFHHNEKFDGKFTSFISVEFTKEFEIIIGSVALWKSKPL